MAVNAVPPFDSMQLPKRKPGKYTQVPLDPIMSQTKFDELSADLHKLIHYKRPHAAKEVARLAELGDFSENVEYQLAKRRLRGINSAITRIEHHLRHAEVVKSGSDDVVSFGSTVTVSADGKERTYQILGASEANPSKGIISHSSPIGQVLIGKKIGEDVIVSLPKGDVCYRILSIT